jgi:hypothetical protein
MNGPFFLKFTKLISHKKVVTKVIPFNRLKYYEVDESLDRVLFRFDDYYTITVANSKDIKEVVNRFETDISEGKKIIEINH